MPYNLKTSDLRLHFPSKGRCAADFIALKNPSPLPGLNPRLLDSVASTLTTTLYQWAVPWLRRLVAGLSPRSPVSLPGQSMWDLWWTKWHWDRLFSEFFGFPLSISFHRRSAYSYIICGMNNMPVSGSSSET
jgi:hypothetical protein